MEVRLLRSADQSLSLNQKTPVSSGRWKNVELDEDDRRENGAQPEQNPAIKTTPTSEIITCVLSRSLKMAP